MHDYLVNFARVAGDTKDKMCRKQKITPYEMDAVANKTLRKTGVVGTSENGIMHLCNWYRTEYMGTTEKYSFPSFGLNIKFYHIFYR